MNGGHRLAEIASLVSPETTALLLCEMQRGIMGDLALSAPLRDACVEEGVTRACARLATAARRAGVTVVHSWLEMREDLRGTVFNTPLLRGARRLGGFMLAGSDRAATVAELPVEDGDLVSIHSYGVSPFASRDLDQVLRNIGVRTLVAAGVSLNEGVVGLCVVGADLGYEIVLPVDACAGTPAEYKDAMLRHTFNLLATQTTSDTLIAAWRDGTGITQERSDRRG